MVFQCSRTLPLPTRMYNNVHMMNLTDVTELLANAASLSDDHDHWWERHGMARDIPPPFHQPAQRQLQPHQGSLRSRLL